MFKRSTLSILLATRSRRLAPEDWALLALLILTGVLLLFSDDFWSVLPF